MNRAVDVTASFLRELHDSAGSLMNNTNNTLCVLTPRKKGEVDVLLREEKCKQKNFCNYPNIKSKLNLKIQFLEKLLCIIAMTIFAMRINIAVTSSYVYL